MTTPITPTHHQSHDRDDRDRRQFIPEPVEGGGTRCGSTYIALADRCWRKWFNSHYRPLYDPAGNLLGRGLQRRTTALPLLSGRLLHEGLAAWYLSGCRNGEDTGERDIERAVTTLAAHALRAEHEYESPDACAADASRLEVTLRSYHDWYGPGGRLQEWPELRVAFDAEGQPVVEREYEIRLSPGYIFTTRIDLVAWHHGFLKTMEHKTSHPMFVRQRLSSARYDAQFTGEAFAMRHLFPDTPLAGVLVNVIVKDRSVNSKFDVAERDTTTRSDAQLERWRSATLATLRDIDRRVEGFEQAAGPQPTPEAIERAADDWFPVTGTRTGECGAFNRDCDFARLCQLPGLEEQALRSFRHRSGEELARLAES